MINQRAAEVIGAWPDESRQAAQLVLDAHGEPAEMSASQLTWYNVGGVKRVTASKTFHAHNFPAPHTDSVESSIDYQVPAVRFGDLARFDGSVVVKRTVGEVSATCHDEQANYLALNLMHDIVDGAKSVEDARNYYAKEFAGYRRKEPTPYMEKLRFEPPSGTADPDERILSDEDLQRAEQEGQQKQ